MTDAGWASDRQAEELADKIAVKAVGNVLGGHKLTCDEHENLQQDFKDVALEAYHQGRVAGLREALEVSRGSRAGVIISLLNLRIAELERQAEGGSQ